MKSLKIIFAGTPEFGLPCLKALHESSHELIAVYTQPDRPAGRGRKLQASAIKSWALEQAIPVYQPVNFKDEATCIELEALKPDLMIVIAYGLILPPRVLSIPRLGCINVHGSLLPAWRGASPIQQTILHGDKSAGITIMQMDKGMDTGDMLMKASCDISAEDTARTLHDKLAEISIDPLLETVNALAEGNIQPEKQQDALATYASKIEKEQALIDWSDSIVHIDRKIRGFNPYPIAWTQAGEEVLRIHQAFVTEKSSSGIQPGTILDISKKGISVATGDRIISLQKIQFPGGKILSVSDWLNAGKKQLYTNLVLQ